MQCTRNEYAPGWQKAAPFAAALGLVAALLAMHGLGGPAMSDASMTTAAPAGTVLVTAPVVDAIPGASGGFQAMVAHEPCLATLRPTPDIASPLLAGAGAELTAIGDEQMTPLAVGPPMRAPPQAVSLTSVCVCRT
jgi:hypothetical protein